VDLEVEGYVGGLYNQEGSNDPNIATFCFYLSSVLVLPTSYITPKQLTKWKCFGFSDTIYSELNSIVGTTARKFWLTVTVQTIILIEKS
jgi:hypothetical protein